MSTKIHKVRFYNPPPQSINCVSLNRNKVLAVARKEASIEIWDLNHAPYLFNFIPGVENGSVEAMGWADNRLFSTGLGGSLVEWDLVNLCMKKSVLLTGYAAWCLDVNQSNTSIAVGTEQGYINIYSIESNDIVYKCLFDKQEGRIMCCKFNKTGNTLVTGSIDTIRIWNVETGHAVNRILASRRGKEVIVWCLEILSDNTIVSGDSHGRLTFWDANVGDQIESFTTHRADILTLTVSENEQSIYCSGVDPTIVNFIKIDNKNKEQAAFSWVKNVQRHIHEHDVRTLLLNGEQLVSAGADGYLTFSSFPPKWVMRIPPLLPTPRSSVSHKKLVLLRYSNHLEIWKLGNYEVKYNGKLVYKDNKSKNNNILENKSYNLEQDTATAKPKRGQPLKVSSNCLKLASIQTKNKKQLKTCGLSPNGQFIIYSTDSSIRMLKLETDDDDERSVSLSKMRIDLLNVSTCEKVAFTQDSSSVIISSSGTMFVLQIDPETGASLQQTISTENHLNTASMLHLSVCQLPSGSTYLVAADTGRSVAVWCKSVNNKFDHYVTLPRYKCVPSAILIDHRHETVVITYVDQKLVEYDLANKRYNEWPNTKLPKSWFKRNSAITSIQVHPQNEHAILFHDELSVTVLEKKCISEETSEPIQKKGGNDNNCFNLRVLPVKYLSGFHWLDKDEAVVLEILPENIVSQLPPVLATKNNKFV